jgi:galactofuranosylgalactofuranosylrhamnosyl-N-acetylglucosaminyl-diphospho-decaprenol beta-1,5/1,6-galactofuranosyltransferase
MTDVAARSTVPNEPDTGDAARLVVARGLFSGPVPEVPDELYVEVLRGIAERRRHHVRVGAYGHVGTNTYFGRFPASYWQRWTTAREVRFEARVHGTGRVMLRASDTNGVPRTVAVHDAHAEEVRLTAPLDRYLDGGGLWIEVVTDDDELLLHDARWTVAAPTADRGASVVVCTHNRADDCVATLRALTDEQDVVDLLDAVVVVDQGTDRIDTREGFADVAERLGGSLRYLPQPNLGGSGGFTRGLHEVVEHAARPDVDVLFMDDDIRCEPEVVVRLAAFGRCVADPTIVGAQMLNLLHPTQVLAGAEYAVLADLTNGHVSVGAVGESDVTTHFPDGTKNVQDRRVDAGYTGWWSCLIPAELVRRVGYPLPLFFQWDDVEYCYRARAHGVATVTLPGAGVWHADFPWKDWDDWHRYFNLRNAMITAALHSSFPVRHLTGVLGDLLARYLLAMNYGLAATLIRAVEDFLVGPEVLDDGGVAAVAAIRGLRAGHGETVAHPVTEAPGFAPTDMEIVRCGPEPTRIHLVMAKRIVQQVLGRTPFRAGLVGAGEAHWWHVSLFDRVAVTDAGQGGVRLRRRDPEVLRSLGREGARVLWRFAGEGGAAARRWRAAAPALTAADNWRRLFDGGGGLTRPPPVRWVAEAGDAPLSARPRDVETGVPPGACAGVDVRGQDLGTARGDERADIALRGAVHLHAPAQPPHHRGRQRPQREACRGSRRCCRQLEDDQSAGPHDAVELAHVAVGELARHVLQHPAGVDQVGAVGLDDLEVGVGRQAEVAGGGVHDLPCLLEHRR